MSETNVKRRVEFTRKNTRVSQPSRAVNFVRVHRRAEAVYRAAGDTKSAFAAYERAIAWEDARLVEFRDNGNVIDGPFVVKGAQSDSLAVWAVAIALADERDPDLMDLVEACPPGDESFGNVWGATVREFDHERYLKRK